MRRSTGFHQLFDWRHYHQQQTRHRFLRLLDDRELLRLPKFRLRLSTIQVVEGLQTRRRDHGEILGEQNIVLQPLLRQSALLQQR